MTIRWRRLLRVPDVMIPLGMAAAIGAVYLSALFLWGVDGDGATAAGNRFLALPPDNVIPTLFADRLEAGASPKHLLGGWLSSDRPPLQTGLILAVRSPLRLTGLAPADVAFAAGVAFQLLWIPALWGLCRRLGGTERLTAVVILATSVSETTLLHSVYTWPKLAAAAFVLGAWTLLLERGARWLPATASLAALAYLSHGGAIFPLLAAVPAAVPVLRTARTKTVLAAVGCLAALALPWVAYQRFYEPPGDRLLKWHLAGVVPIDSRSFPDALVDQYGEIGIAGTVKNKVENVQFLAKGSFIPLLVPVVASSAERRHDEFHYLLRGLAFGLVPLALYLFTIGRRSRDERATALWVGGTLFVWVVLMFGPGTTDVHQGSLAVPLLLLALPAKMLAERHPPCFAALVMLQVASTAVTWLPQSAGPMGRLHMVPALVLVGAFIVMAVALRPAVRTRVSRR